MAKNTCRLMCAWEEPEFNGREISYIWREKEIGLDELTLDYKNQRAFYFDFDTHHAELVKQIEQKNISFHGRNVPDAADTDLYEYQQRIWDDLENAFEEAPEKPRLMTWETYKEEQTEDEKYRQALVSRYGIPPAQSDTVENCERYWIRAGVENNHRRDQEAIWSYYIKQFQEKFYYLPVRFNSGYYNLLNALYSLKENAMIGTNLPNLKALENQIYIHYRSYYRFFAFGIKYFGADKALDLSNPHSTCAKHIREYKKNQGKAGFIQDNTPMEFVQYLFPEFSTKPDAD